jgi:hypothetical protein
MSVEPMDRVVVSLAVLGALALAGCACPSYFRSFHGRLVDGMGAPVTGNVVSSVDDGGVLHSARTDEQGVFHVLATGVKSGNGYGGNEACIPQMGKIDPGSRVCKLSSNDSFELQPGDGEVDLGTLVLGCSCDAGTHAAGTSPETCAAD